MDDDEKPNIKVAHINQSKSKNSNKRLSDSQIIANRMRNEVPIRNEANRINAALISSFIHELEGAGISDVNIAAILQNFEISKVSPDGAK